MNYVIQQATRLACVLSAIFMTACVYAPPRSDERAFFSIQRGQISSANVQSFADCVTDGFAVAHSLLANISSRQNRRSDGFRIESYNRVGVMASADVFDDGRVELLEAKAAALIDTSGERDAFASCLKKYGKAA